MNHVPNVPVAHAVAPPPATATRRYPNLDTTNAQTNAAFGLPPSDYILTLFYRDFEPKEVRSQCRPPSFAFPKGQVLFTESEFTSEFKDDIVFDENFDL